MKKILLVLTVLTAIPAFAADEFSCEVNQKVLRPSTCIECVERRAEDCLREEEVPCLQPRIESTGVGDSYLHPLTDFFLGKTQGKIGFLISQSKSGYTARVSYGSRDATFSSSRQLDPYRDSIRLSAHTGETQAEGSVLEVILSCQPL